MSKPTPGEWTWKPEKLAANGGHVAGRGPEILAGDRAIAHVHTYSTSHVPESEANARLFAASKDLLEACRWALRGWTETPPIGISHAELLTKLRAAIEKAEGR
jgi:hypothetical protein